MDVDELTNQASTAVQTPLWLKKWMQISFSSSQQQFLSQFSYTLTQLQLYQPTTGWNQILQLVYRHSNFLTSQTDILLLLRRRRPSGWVNVLKHVLVWAFMCAELLLFFPSSWHDGCMSLTWQMTSPGPETSESSCQEGLDLWVLLRGGGPRGMWAPGGGLSPSRVGNHFC